MFISCMAGGPISKSNSFDFRELPVLECSGWFWGGNYCDSTWGVAAAVDSAIGSSLLEFEREGMGM